MTQIRVLPSQERKQLHCNGTEQSWLTKKQRQDRLPAVQQCSHPGYLPFSWLPYVQHFLCVCESSPDSPINSSFLPWLVWVGSQASVGGKLTQLLCGLHTDTRIHAWSVSGHQKIQMGLHNNHTSVLLGEEGHRTLWLCFKPQGQELPQTHSKQNKTKNLFLTSLYFCTYILIFNYFEKFSSIFWKVSVFCTNTACIVKKNSWTVYWLWGGWNVASPEPNNYVFWAIAR